MYFAVRCRPRFFLYYYCQWYGCISMNKESISRTKTIETEKNRVFCDYEYICPNSLSLPIINQDIIVYVLPSVVQLEFIRNSDSFSSSEDISGISDILMIGQWSSCTGVGERFSVIIYDRISLSSGLLCCSLRRHTSDIGFRAAAVSEKRRQYTLIRYPTL